MAEDPVTIVKGGTLAQNILGSAPEGMLIAPAWKRVLGCHPHQSGSEFF